VNAALKDEGRWSSQSRHSSRFRKALVISEVALAIVLLIGAGLMVRTLAMLNSVSLGLNPADVLTLRVQFSGERYSNPQSRVQFWRRVVAEVQNLPGISSVSVARGVQLNDWSGQWFVTAENPTPAAGEIPDANYVIAGPDYFRTLQIPLQNGRGFDEHDTQAGEQVVIVNQELARQQWPGQNAVGKQLRVGPPTAPWRTVIGVVGNVLSQGADAGVHSELYVPYQQFPWLLDGPHNLLIRISAGVNPEILTRAVVEKIHREDKGLAVADIVPLEQLASEPLQEQRMVMALLIAFATLAAILSGLGMYSVLAYLIARRTHEMGVRMALGARPRHVFGIVLGEGLRMTLSGILVGLVAAFALTRVMASLLFGVRPTDLATFTVAVVLLFAIAVLACFIPARRAANVDPMEALRYE